MQQDWTSPPAHALLCLALQVAPEIISNADFTKELAASLNRPAVIPAPAFALNLVLGAERASVLLEGQVRSDCSVWHTPCGG